MMHCTDVAGNVGSATYPFEYIDSSPPAIDFVLNPAPVPVGGFYTGDVTLTWSVTEAQSPESLVKTGCVDQSVTSDRPYATYSCAATSAGGEASVVEVEFGRDATRPTITASVSGPSTVAGWYTGDVTVTFTCTDATSGVATDTVPDAILTTDGAGQSVTTTGACIDKAGNTANPATVAGINLDRSAPTAVLAITGGTAGDGGWYTSAVTLHTSGADDISGPVTCTADQMQTADTSSATFEGTCTNAAGLTHISEAITIKVDKTPPTLAPTLSTDEVAVDGAISVVANATDATSGVASASCASLDTSTPGTHSAECTATDNAGNVATGTVDYEVHEVEATILFGYPPPRDGGFGTFAFSGGTFEQLLSVSGCPETTSIFFYNKTDGGFAAWIPGADVAAVNAEFLAIFPGSPPLPDHVIFTARCV
jgi:hypothetical protein